MGILSWILSTKLSEAEVLGLRVVSGERGGLVMNEITWAQFFNICEWTVISMFAFLILGTVAGFVLWMVKRVRRRLLFKRLCDSLMML